MTRAVRALELVLVGRNFTALCTRRIPSARREVHYRR